MSSEGPVALGGAKRRGLLAYLVVHIGQVVSLDRLVDALWGEQPSKGARGTVQTYLSQLRKLFAADDDVSLETHPGGYTLRIPTDHVDAARFERLCAQAVAEPDTCRRLQIVDEALALWRGPPLGEFNGAEWAVVEATRLDALHLQTVQQRIGALLNLGRHDEAIPELEGFVGEYRLDEHFWAQLMLAYYRAGRQADALRAYQHVRSVLADDLGIEPGSELTDLERDILDQDPRLDVPPSPGELSGERSRASTTTPLGVSRSDFFVGRARELAEIGPALDAALDGRGTFALVSGEPGIGKTRLAERVGTLATERGARVLWARCFEGGSAPAYWPLLQVLRAYIEDQSPATLASELGADAGELARILPELRQLLPGSDVAPADDDGARFRLFDAVFRVLRRAAARQPLVIVMDDLHWADRSTLYFLEFAAGMLATVPVLIIVTYRNAERDAGYSLLVALGELLRAPGVVSVELEGFDIADISTLVAKLTDVDPDDELVARLAARTEGNPFFVKELVRFLASEGTVDSADVESGLPETVRAAIARRLDRLGPAARELLSIAAVLGPDFDCVTLQLLSDGSSMETDDLLDASAAAQLIEETGAYSYRFTHALVRQVLYEDQSPSRRAHLHRRAAEVIDTRDPEGPDSVADVARHWFFGARPEDVPQAVAASMRAADQARSLFAHDDAAGHYERALSLLDLDPASDSRRRVEILLALGEARMRGGHLADARPALAMAGELAMQISDGPSLAAAALAYHGPPRVIAIDRTEVRLLEAALALNRDTCDPGLQALLHAQLSAALPDGSSPKQRHSQEALRFASGTTDPIALNAALNAKFWTLFVPGALQEQLRTADEAVAAARRAEAPELLVQSLILRLLALYSAGDPNRAAGVVDEIATIAEARKEPYYLGYVEADRARRLIAAGDLSEAEAAVLESGAAANPELADGTGVIRGVHVQILSIRSWQRRADELIPLIRDLMLNIGDENPAGLAPRLALLRALAESGSISEARTEWEQFAETEFEILTPIGGWRRLMELALAAQVCSRLADARRAGLLRRLLAPWEGMQAQTHTSVYLGPVTQFLGMLEHLVGDDEAAVSHLEDALAFTDRAGAWAHSAEIRCELARVLLARDAPGDHQRAQALIGDARRAAAARSLVRVVHDCEQLAVNRVAAGPS